MSNLLDSTRRNGASWYAPKGITPSYLEKYWNTLFICSRDGNAYKRKDCVFSGELVVAVKNLTPEEREHFNL